MVPEVCRKQCREQEVRNTYSEILCTRTNQEIWDTVRCYQLEFGWDLGKARNLRTLWMSLHVHVPGKTVLNITAQTTRWLRRTLLTSTRWGKLQKDVSCFNMVLSTRSFPQLKAPMEAYSKMANGDFLSGVSQEFHGHVESGLKTILWHAVNCPAFFAEWLTITLWKAMAYMTPSWFRL